MRASGNANNKNISGVGPPYVLRTMAKHLLTHTLFGLFGEITYEMKFYIFTVSTPTYTYTHTQHYSRSSHQINICLFRQLKAISSRECCLFCSVCWAYFRQFSTSPIRCSTISLKSCSYVRIAHKIDCNNHYRNECVETFRILYSNEIDSFVIGNKLRRD